MGALVCLVIGVPGAAWADPVWDGFAARCLTPYETMAEPVTEGLSAGEDGVWEGDGVVLEVADDTCAVRGAEPGDLSGLLAGFEDYEEVDDGVWQSTTWREPRIEVEALEDGYLVRETDLES